MKRLIAIVRKELQDALRDRRTLAVVLVSSILMGPLLMVALSQLLATLEAQAERRVVMVQGLEHTPSLHNFLARQTFRIDPAPTDFEAQLRSSQLTEAVVVVPPNFDAQLERGAQPALTLIFDSGNRASQSSAARVQRLLEAYRREHTSLSLLLQGAPMRAFEPMQLHERDLASQQSRAAQLTSMLPFFVIMAVLYGALNAALDTTAGERERRSLEPLLVNPAPRWTLVVGKWLAVVSVAMLIATLSALSFVPAQWLLRSDTLQAMFQFGLHEALLFITILLPLALALSAALMAVAIRCKTFKEAQASSSVLVLLTSMLPLATVFNQHGEAPWHLWLPALAQHTLMSRVLKGQAIEASSWAVPGMVCVLITLTALWATARSLRSAAMR
jgi:sodium transport system permease protein